MSNIISADNGSFTGIAGIKLSSDTSGALALQTGNNVTALTVDSSQNLSLVGGLTVRGMDPLGVANSAFGQANLAYTSANSASGVATAGFGQANSAFAQANGAYIVANSAFGNSGSAIGQANLAYTTANSGVGIGTSAFGQANLAYTTANSGVGIATSAFGQANLAYTTANSGVGIATSAFGQANLAYTTANSGVGIGTSAFGQANLAYTAANSAVTSGQANVGAGLITTTSAYQANSGAGLISLNNSLTSAYQANSGAGLITEVAARQANTGAGLITLSSTLTSAYQANTGAGLISLNTSLTSAYQANVGAGLIATSSTITSAYQANTGAGLITEVAARQANTGAGLITLSSTLTSAYQANTGAGLITEVAARQANTGAGLLTKLVRGGAIGNIDYNAQRTLASGIYSVDAAPTNGPGASYSNFIQMYERGDTSAQIVVDYATGRMFSRGIQTATPTYSAWRTQIDDGNYNSYAPTLTGTGASGTWGIRVTGFANAGTSRLYASDGSYTYDGANPYYMAMTYDGSRWLLQVTPGTPAAVRVSYADSAGSAGSATTATTATTANALNTSNNYSVNQLLNNTWYNYNDNDRNAGSATYYPNVSARAVRFFFAGAGTTSTGGNYAGVMQFNPWDGTTASTGDASYQLAFGSTAANSGGVPQLNIRKGIDTTWNSWYTLLHSGNYTSYAPSLTGSGASGTWGINVTGNAVTAGGLAVATGVNSTANQIVRTDGSGYIQAGWINSVSGDNGLTTIARITASSDAYLRYYSPANFNTAMNRSTFIRESNGGTLVAGNIYSIYTGGGAVGMYLPTPGNTSQGDTIRFINLLNTWASNPFYVYMNGSTYIMGDSSTMTCNINAGGFTLVCAYHNGTAYWVVTAG